MILSPRLQSDTRQDLIAFKRGRHVHLRPIVNGDGSLAFEVLDLDLAIQCTGETRLL